MIRSFQRVPDAETWLEDSSASSCKSCRGCARPAVRQLNADFIVAADLYGHPDVITLRIADSKLWRALLLGLGLPLAGLVSAVAVTESWSLAEPVQAICGLMGLGIGICLARWLSAVSVQDMVEIMVEKEHEN